MASGIPKLKILLEQILPQEQQVDDFEVEHTFEHIGPKTMLLNAREIVRQNNRQRVILIAIEDITAKKALEAHAREAETQINSILENLIDSAERHTGGTAPNYDNR